MFGRKSNDDDTDREDITHVLPDSCAHAGSLPFLPAVLTSVPAAPRGAGPRCEGIAMSFALSPALLPSVPWRRWFPSGPLGAILSHSIENMLVVVARDNSAEGNHTPNAFWKRGYSQQVPLVCCHTCLSC